MSTHRYFDKICCVILALTLVLTILFMNAESFGIPGGSSPLGYETRLFDTSKVHTINIVMENWEEFIESCTDEEYAACSVIIDNESYKNVAIRAKGNTSLSNVQNYGNNRYSFKIEFDHYDSGKTYHGLDKLSLNNMIQDNTYMKDYLSYQMMGYFGVNAPLCSYVQILVNGEEWGLYLAVEGVEDSFLSRNYGNNYGKLYKPDSMGMNMGSSDVSLIYSDDNYDSYQNIFDNAKTDITSADKDRFIASLKKLNENSSIEDVVNVEEVIRYFVVHNFVCNFDSYTGSMIHNYYLYEKDGQFSMIPWDYNLAFGGFVGGSDATSLVNYPIDTPVSGGTTESRPMLSWIFENEEYTELYHQYFAEFISQYFDSGYFAEMADNVTSMISSYIKSDPTKFCTYEEFEKGIHTLKEFCLLRAKSINAQLKGTIASTSENQETETLIDASSLTLSDMGSMDNMGGRAGLPEQQPQEMQNPGTGETQHTFAPPIQENTRQNENNSSPGQGMPRPNDSGGQITNQPATVGPGSYLLFAACCAVLLAGLLFALFYQKRV